MVTTTTRAMAVGHASTRSVGRLTWPAASTPDHLGMPISMEAVEGWTRAAQTLVSSGLTGGTFTAALACSTLCLQQGTS